LYRIDQRVRFAVTALAAMAIVGFVSPSHPQRPQTELVRWTCSGHDWLLVADRRHDRLSAYDARDGRPLGTLDRSSGLADVDRLVLEGCWLVVLGKDEPQLVRLPELRPQPLALALR
jgi:hypothetical protein